VDAETINTSHVEPLDKDQIFDQVEEFTDKIAEIYQDISMEFTHMTANLYVYAGTVPHSLKR